MSDLNLIRAWKDEEYRSTLGADDLAGAPPNPAGAFGMSLTEVNEIMGPHGSLFICPSDGCIPCSLIVCPTLLGGPICPILY